MKRVKTLFFGIFLMVESEAKGDFAGTAETAWKEWTSPFTTDAKYYLYSGSLLTGIFVLDGVEDTLGHDIQNETVENKPLGDFSPYGDMAGQMVPNIIYSTIFYGIGYYGDDVASLRKAVHMFKSSAYTAFSTTMLKAIVREPRPDSNNRDSFPSGHTASAFAFAAVVGTEHEWYWGVSAYTLATFVAFSRINDNAHRLHDVVGGAVLGLSYGLSIHFLYKDENSSIAKFSLLPTPGGLMLGYRTEF